MTLSPTARRILTAIVAEPGERTVAQLAAELHLDRAEVARHVHQLSRRGLLTPRLVRAHPWLTRCGALESPLESLVLDEVQKGPQDLKTLALLCDVAPTDGGFKSALKRLHAYGSISLPAEMDPSEAGIEAVAEAAEVACAA